METVKRIKYEPDPNKFDLRTHEWNAQGHLVSKNLYRKFLIGDAAYYERPVNSGNLWLENNQPAGRVELTFGPTGKIASKKFNFDAPHKVYSAPLTGADKLHFELEQANERTATLEAEIAAIKKELEARQTPEKPKKAAAPQAETPLAESIASPEAEEKPAAQAVPKLTKRGST